jgi:hypothetical protein
MLILIVALFLAVHAADLALTLRGVAMGKRERNPVARWLMRRIGKVPGLVLLKVTTVAGALLLAMQLPPLWQAGTLAALALVGVPVVVHNLRVLRRGRRARS